MEWNLNWANGYQLILSFFQLIFLFLGENIAKFWITPKNLEKTKMVGTNQWNYLVSRSGRTSCRKFVFVRCWSRSSLVSAREKVIPTNESTWSVRTNELQEFFFVRFWSRSSLVSAPGGSDTNQRNYLVSLDERVAEGIIVRHSVVRYWSRVSLVSERKKVVPTNETIWSVRMD
jgi:hypothetical protein